MGVLEKLLKRYLIYYFDVITADYLHQNNACSEMCLILVQEASFAPKLFAIGIAMHCSETPASQ